VQLRGGDQAEKTIRLLRRFQNAAEQPARMRNRVVHNPMARKDGQAKLWRLSADRKLIFEYENITWDELRDIMDKINDLITDFENIFPPNVDAH